MSETLANLVNVARREYTVRVRTRSFIMGTLLLVVGVAAIALLPVIIRYIDDSSATKIAVVVEADDVGGDPVTTLRALLNPTTAEGSADRQPDFVVESVGDLAAGRQDVVDGRYGAILAVRRAPSGDLAFVLYTNDQSNGRTAALVRQGTNAIAIADRLERLGVAPGDQATLFVPASFSLGWPDPTRTDPTSDTAAAVGEGMLAFGMTVLIFLMIIMYGTWIAMSVVEEKSSRVMEVVLNAATPFQLLTGKVFGVGAVALTQYAAIVIAGVAALLLQGTIATTVLGESGSVGLPQGLTPEMLLAFGVYGVLGFVLYACLFAAAGSLVSRQEDVNSVVMPMTLISTGGYLIGIYAATGLLDIRSGWVTLLAQIPFFSPFMMLGRLATGVAEPWEIVVSISLLVVAIAGALWLAARIYRAGVLLYGQRPAIGAVIRLVRSGI